MQVEEFLERSARRLGGKTALVCGERRFTYQEVNDCANVLAHSMISEGIMRGDRVAVYMDNTPEAVISIYAILKAGAVFLMINPTTKSDKLAYILNNSRARGILTDFDKFKAAQECWKQTPHLSLIFVGRANSSDLSSPNGAKVLSLDHVLQSRSSTLTAPRKRCIDIDLAALIYTSGSTGRPKGVMMAHLNIVTAATSITTRLENHEGDIIFSVLPLSFNYGLYQSLMAFLFGGTLVLERSFNYTYASLDKMVKEKATGLPIVPTMMAILLQMNLEPFDFSNLRYITNTAAALPTDHIQLIRKTMPGVAIYSMYGLTECKRACCLPPDQIDIRPTSVGLALPNEELYLVNEADERLGPGEVGELVVRGANVMKGYWELPEETEKVLRPGPLPGEKVLYTGDLFKTDEEGYLYFVGRKDDIIKSQGEKVSPVEVENVLYKLREVEEAGVVGISDRILGDLVCAVVMLREGATLTENDLLLHCNRHLEIYMIPKKVIIRKEHLPRTETGKLNKRTLKIQIEEGQL
ncbi:MAG: AMP-binding protein [Nitrospirota bacterium]